MNTQWRAARVDLWGLCSDAATEAKTFDSYISRAYLYMYVDLLMFVILLTCQSRKYAPLNVGMWAGPVHFFFFLGGGHNFFGWIPANPESLTREGGGLVDCSLARAPKILLLYQYQGRGKSYKLHRAKLFDKQKQKEK